MENVTNLWMRPNVYHSSELSINELFHVLSTNHCKILVTDNIVAVKKSIYVYNDTCWSSVLFGLSAIYVKNDDPELLKSNV